MYLLYNIMRYRAIMICDFNNPVSMKYANIARKTWEGVKIRSLDLWQCYTPDTRHNASFRLSYYGKNWRGDKFTETEKSCFTSMFHWWKHIADTNETVIILEHDAYVTHVEKLNTLIDSIPHHYLWVPGIAAECVVLHPIFAKYVVSKVFTDNIGLGPLGTLHKYIIQKGLAVKKHKGTVGLTTMPTSHRNNTIGTNAIYSENDLANIYNQKSGLQESPITQCYYSGRNTTIAHKDNELPNYAIGNHRNMKCLD